MNVAFTIVSPSGRVRLLRRPAEFAHARRMVTKTETHYFCGFRVFGPNKSDTRVYMEKRNGNECRYFPLGFPLVGSPRSNFR